MDETPWNAAREVLQRVPRLHSAPKVVLEVLRLTADPDFNVQELIACIQADPALTAQILHAVNSPRFGVARRISNLRQAISLLGRRTLRLLATSFNLVSSLANGLGADVYRRYQRLAMTVAVSASRLAALHHPELKDEVFAAGLLADVGSLAMLQDRTQPYAAVYLHDFSSAALREKEHAMFKVEHAILGAVMLDHWNFPLELIRMVGDHHGPIMPPTADCGPAAELVRAGAWIAELMWCPNHPGVSACRAFLWRHFAMDTDGFIDTVLKTKEEVAAELEGFGVSLPPTLDCEAILEQARCQQLETALETALDLDSLANAFGAAGE